MLPINVFEVGAAILVAMHVENNTAKNRMRMKKRFHLSLLDNCITMSDRLRERSKGSCSRSVSRFFAVDFRPFIWRVEEGTDLG